MADVSIYHMPVIINQYSLAITTIVTAIFVMMSCWPIMVNPKWPSMTQPSSDQSSDILGTGRVCLKRYQHRSPRRCVVYRCATERCPAPHGHPTSWGLEPCGHRFARWAIRSQDSRVFSELCHTQFMEETASKQAGETCIDLQFGERFCKRSVFLCVLHCSSCSFFFHSSFP